MKITTVSLSRTIPTGPYMNDKVGMEATIGPDESEVEALDTLQRAIENWHKKANPHLYQETNIPFTQRADYVPPPSTLTTATNAHEPLTINIQHERIQIQIENAESIGQLMKVKGTTPLMPVSLMNLYNQKMEQLTNG